MHAGHERTYVDELYAGERGHLRVAFIVKGVAYAYVRSPYFPVWCQIIEQSDMKRAIRPVPSKCGLQCA